VPENGMNEEQAWEEVSRLVAGFGVLSIEVILLGVILYMLFNELRDELQRRKK
jgi:hypothetical protein